MAETMFDTLVRELRESELKPEEISKASGVPLGTVSKIIHGHTKNPRILTVEKLQKVVVEHRAAT